MLNLSHKKLDLYQVALKLVKEIYQQTKGFPDSEKFGLTSQLRRASISVCSNIAEGSSRISLQEKKRFFEMSRSSAVEIDSQLEISLTLEYLKREAIKELENYMERTFMMLCKLIEQLNKRIEETNSKNQ